MKLKKLHILSLLVSTLTFTSCSAANNYDEYLKYPHGTIGEYYNSSWKQGNKALKDADKPTIKNPKGVCFTVNDLKRSQDKMGIPSLGEANILVVPVTFKGDENVKENIDLSFSTNDIKAIKELYFGGERSSYPSVKTYFKTSSYNKFNLDGVVSPVVTFNQDFITFLSGAANGGKSVRDLHSELVSYVYNYLFNETETYYIGDFDADNDRRVDSIQILVNYPLGYTTRNNINNSVVDNAITQFLNYDNVYFHKDNNEDSPINSYTVSSEYIRNIENKSGNQSHVSIYHIARCLGIDNLSDLTGDFNKEIYRSPLAYKDMMDAFVGDLNSFSKYLLGWISPKKYTKEDIEGEYLDVNISSFEENGDTILLHTGNDSIYSEYLLIDLFSGTKNNSYDKGNNYTIFGTNLFSKVGVRIYQIDARLVRGDSLDFNYYNGEIDLNESTTSFNGVETNYIYDFSHTNNGINNYYQYGITDDEPLVAILDNMAFNRHITGATSDLMNPNYADNLFLFNEGASFGNDDIYNGIYHEFKFHNGEYLDMRFEISSILDDASAATIRLFGGR